MFGLGNRRPKGVDEFRAAGEIGAIYHQATRVLRISGVGVCLRALAAHPRFFATMWEQLLPILETRLFEDAADRLRMTAAELGAQLAVQVGPVSARDEAGLGPSQRFQLDAALALHHYADAKLLLMFTMVAQGLAGGADGRAEVLVGQELIERGVPRSMAPMEMVPDPPTDPQARRVLKDMNKRLELQVTPGQHRALAMWPRYLALAWRDLERIAVTTKFDAARAALAAEAERAARELPRMPMLAASRIAKLGENERRITELARGFQRSMPILAIEVALCALEVVPPNLLASSPFPAERRRRTHALEGVSGAPEDIAARRSLH